MKKLNALGTGGRKIDRERASCVPLYIGIGATKQKSILILKDKAIYYSTNNSSPHQSITN